jgi:benzoyl-CoA reductase subunit BamC
MCEADPPLAEPMCVQVCQTDALTYTEREEGAQGAGAQAELDLGLETLVKKHGLGKLVETLNRMSKKT